MRMIFVCLYITTLFFCQNVFAGNRSLPEVEPVIYEGVEYVAKVDTIEAWDAKRRIRLWELRLYNISLFISEDYLNRPKEQPYAVDLDHLWPCIDSMKIEDSKLIVTNEAGGVYEVDLKSRVVEQIQDEDLTDRPV